MAACCAMGQNSQPLSEVVRSGWVPTSFIHSLIQSLPFMSSRVHAFVVHRALICSLSFASHRVISSHVTPRHVMPCSIQLLSVHSFIFSTHAQTHTRCSMTPTSPGQPWEPILQAGMQLFACSACSRGRGSGLPPSSASTFWQPRCLLLVARPQQTRLIEPTLYPNLVVRGWHRMLARQ